MNMLNGIRALDLTDEAGFFCDKILAHFGVDVIKHERGGICRACKLRGDKLILVTELI